MAIKFSMLYALTINIVAFCMMAVDKEKARRGQWRIPESTLLLAAFVGGSVGAYLGMKLCRHKTRRWYFCYGIPACMLVHAASLVMWGLAKLLG